MCDVLGMCRCASYDQSCLFWLLLFFHVFFLRDVGFGQVPKVQEIAINDSFILEAHVFKVSLQCYSIALAGR